MAAITLKNIKKSFGPVNILHDINLEVKAGEFVVLIGESGCGKSTLLRMIAGLEPISEGELWINNILSNHVSPQKRDISMVFQSYALYPHLNVYDNIAYGMKVQKVPKDEIKRKVQKASGVLNIAHLLDRYPKNLSGGQRQRVAMGRAIVRDPVAFLFDEPLSNLDAKLRVVMRKEIKQLQKKLNTTTIYVTHDQIEAMTMADKVVLMNQGYIVQIGSPKELFDRPNSIFTATFLGAPGITMIDGTVKKNGDKFQFFTKDEIEMPIGQYQNLEDNQKIVLGIRPRDFILSDEKNGFHVKTELIEYTGAEYIIYGNIGENETGIVFSRKENFDDTVPLFVNYDLEKMHLFDKKTGQVILN